MFDFMAAGLAVVSTPVGARGIDAHIADCKSPKAMIVAEAEEFAGATRAIIDDGQGLEEVGAAGRMLVERDFAWEKISPRLGRLLIDRYDGKDWNGFRNEQQSNDDAVTTGSHAVPEPERARGFPTDVSFEAAVPREIAILTTWGIHCGIAEYSMYLVEAFADQAVSCLILSNSDPEAGKAQPDNIVDIKPVWDYGFADPKRVAKACRDASIDMLNIQHHPAFFSADVLMDIVNWCSHQKLEVSVTLHNSVDISEDDLSALAASGATVVVHNEIECRTLADLGAEKAHYIPHGVLEVTETPRDGDGPERGPRNFPLVGSFGFLRPHKGILELIDAVGLLRVLYPDVKLLGMNALFPTPDSEEYHAKCMARIRELGLEEHVEINTAFLEITDVITRLAACDLIVLPYHPSTENASGSINIAAAAKQPIVVTRQRIFEELEGFLHKVESP
jgi:glycosyltransferase involved in cell wall biosynthesis